ncbi:MAG: (2Fe-2S) ferredoxin domain-containing protein [Armatimonadetes bacterium]|nr:(2Fe-2S) ferredoxin domain-containing protein [Armatimonadota bacterium]
MKSREELAALRERARQALAVRDRRDGPRVVVAMGTCGIAAGARDTMAALLDELAQRGITNVSVTQTGCKGLCDREPMVEVHMPGGQVVTYGDVTGPVMRRIVAEHIVNGQIVTEYAIATRTEGQ